MPPRPLIAVNARFLEEPASGRGVLVAALVARFARRDPRRFVLFVPDRLAIGERACGLRTVVIPPASIGCAGDALAWDRRFTTADTFRAERIDIVWQPYFRIPERTGAWRLAVTVHDLINLEYLSWRAFLGGRFPYKLLSTGMLADRLLDPRRIRRADAVATVSRHVTGAVTRLLGYPADRITTIANGIDEVFRRPPAAAALRAGLARHGLARDGYLLYVGGMVYRKNVGRLVRAFGRLPADLRARWPLALVGTGYWETRLRRKAPRDVRFLGRVPAEDLAPLYAGARAFVYPSLAEGFGLPVLEAAFCGAAVATTSISAQPELAADFARAFDPFSVASMAAALADVLVRPEDFRLTGALRRRKLALYDWDRAADAYLELFAGLAAGKPSSD